jgi:DNA polymerase
MTHLIRRGRLEVETDLLLGVEDVLLPLGHGAEAIVEVAEGAEAVVHRNASPAKPAGRFDAALFSPTRSEPQAQRVDAARPRVDAAPPRVDVAPPRVDAAPPRVDVRPGAIVEPRGAAALPEAFAPIVDRVVPPAGATRAERLAALERQHAAECPHCTAATAHTSLVFGDGNPDADLVFVGEAPGETEDRSGRPFDGPAGEKLNEMIQAMGLRREDVYIALVLKSRPPNNRTPLAAEIERCGPYLLAQLAIIRPKAIVTLGGPATKLLLASELGITRLRGVPATARLGVAEGEPFEVPVMPTFHPAYLIRNYTVETRRQVWSDLKQALAMIGRDAPRRA